MKYDVVTIGAATQDVFLLGKAFRGKRLFGRQQEVFQLGAKIEVEQAIFDTGGGAMNAAVTFARQGLATMFMGKLGHDAAGREVIHALTREKVHHHKVVYDPKLGTGYAALMLSSTGERTVLVYRGASHNFKTADFDLSDVKADWVYATSLAGNLKLASAIFKRARQNGAKVAFNPGGPELDHPRDLRRVLQSVDLLLINSTEAQQLVEGARGRALFKILHAFGPEIIVVTDGPKGSITSDGQFLYKTGLYQKVKVVDRTGAGDAYGSGFVAALAKGLPIETALTLAAANSTSVVRSVGAKTGILKSVPTRDMAVKKVKL